MQLKEHLKNYCNSKKDKNRNKEYNVLKQTGIVDFQEAYDILEGKEYCYCGNAAKFISLKKGYSKYCSYNCLHKDNFYSIDNIKANYDNLTTGNVKQLLKLYNMPAKDLYISLFGSETCIHCDNEATFYSFTKGFSKYCSISCSNKDKNFTRTSEENEAIQLKRKQTTLKKYGVEHNYQLLDKTGKNNIMSNDNTSIKSKKAKSKKKNTMIERYNRTSYNYGYHILNRENLNEEFIIKNFVYTDCKKDKFDLIKCMEYFNCSRTYFNKFNLPKQINYGEEWIFDIIDGKRNDRTLIKPLEIDVLNDKYKMAVEFNGLAFHSLGISKSSVFNTSKNLKTYHVRKTILVEEKGYQLFHVFENEYLDIKKRKIWESVFLSKMQKTNKIYARKCIIKEVQNSESEKFLDRTHLQGSIKSKIKIGLYYENELVSIMTFGKPRFNKNAEWEILRMSSELNTTIVGGASKLLKYFERNYNPKSILSYANRRWSQGNVYTKLGFEFTHNTGPGYFYFKTGSNELESRNKYQKHKLKDKLEIYDSKLTETENMYNNGYRKIYDCGNKVYIKRY